ncbi:ferritin-like domain-containing protein [uncultured Deinococcus sp.]|uniref:ferritin-like domain-containing protein n=2 Tax=uncultured Deinococcus sp. TaxID=158789 RepID=UPI00258CCF96|nr:ferritin-like domain-containing protein [uncultured Deinococcus sp.]
MSNDTNTPTSTRRKFLGMAGMMGAGAVLAGCSNVIATQPSKANYDAEIFNFALNLEYLEAAFYLAAVGRLGELTTAGGDASKVKLPSTFTGASNGVGIPGMSAEVRQYADEIATDELNHVKVIRSVLGAAAVAQPVIDLDSSFKAAGSAASGGAITGFDPYANELFFLHGAFVFEDVGVSAYKGAARFLVDDSSNGNLENAAGILAIEAYHSGAIRTLLYQRRDTVAAAGLTVAQIVQAISDLRDSVDGNDDRDQGIVVNGKANIVLADSNSIAYSRTPRQVGNIVFLKPGATSGGFFPNGLSGSFTNILSL